MNYDEKCQLLIIGDSNVGKTSLLIRYSENKFNSHYLATVGIDYYSKNETILGKNVRVKVWDTAGQERYKSLTNGFFRNAQGILLVYDVTNPDSFFNLKFWLQSINTNIGETTEIKKIIIGNKIDLQRNVNKKDAENFAELNNVSYFETSAKDDIGIQDCIKTFVENIIKDKICVPERETMRLTDKINQHKTSKSYCKC